MRFAPDGRVVRGREERPDQGVRQPLGPDADGRGPTSARKVHDFWDRGLLGLALDPNFAARPVHLRRSTPTTRRRTRAQQPRWGDDCPTPPGATDDGCVITGRLSRLVGGRRRDRPDRGLVPAVPEPLDRQPRVRRRRRAVRQRRRRRELQLRRLRAGRQPAQPVRGPAGGRRRDADAADRRGRRAAQPGHPHDRRPDRRSTARSCASTRTPAPRCRATRTSAAPTSTRRRIVAHGLRNPFRITVRPGTNEVWAGDVGWNTWEEINRIQTPDGGTTNFGWPCYEGDGRQGAYDAPQPEPLREPLRRRRDGRRRAVLHVQPHGQGRRRRDLPDRRLVDLRPRVLHRRQLPAPRTTARCSSPTTAATASGSMLAGANGLPDPATRQIVRAPAPPARSTSRSGPDGDLYYVDMDGGTIRRDPRLEQQPRADRASRPRRPTTGAVPLTVNFDGRGSSDPDGDTLDLRLGPRRRRHVRRLDRRHAEPHLHDAAARYTVAPARHRPRRADGHDDRDRHGRQRRRPATITTPAAGDDLDGRRHDRLRRLGGRTRPGSALPASALTWQREPPALHARRRDELPHAHRSQTSPASRRLVRRARPRVPVVPRAPAHRDATPTA